MFTDKIPMNILQAALKQANLEAALNYSKSLESAGKTLSPDDLKTIDMIANISELYFFSMIKQIDIYEASLQHTDK